MYAAKVIDFEEFRKRRAEREAQSAKASSPVLPMTSFAASPFVYGWVPMLVWVPGWIAV